MTPAPDFATLTVSTSDGLGRLTLDQPDQLNPLGTDTLAELVEAARWFDDQRTRVVIVGAAGERAFCSGFDLRQFETPTPGERDGADLGARMADAIEAMEAVTIAAVFGHCVGGGVVLAAACDLRVAADSTRFSIPEVDLGIPLAWGGIPRLVREIGPAMTRELVMTCRPFDAGEAQALGFVNRVVPHTELDATCQELADQLLMKAPSVLRATKRQVHTAIEQVASTRDGWTGEPILAAARADPEAKDAARRYLDRRKAT